MEEVFLKASLSLVISAVRLLLRMGSGFESNFSGCWKGGLSASLGTDFASGEKKHQDGSSHINVFKVSHIKMAYRCSKFIMLIVCLYSCRDNSTVVFVGIFLFFAFADPL